MLSPEERVRADRFLFPADGQHFTVARAALREVLGEALGIPPGQVVLTYGAHGKPALAGLQAASGLRFNLSHSGARALVGLARGAELGVDLEVLRPMTDRDALVRRFFSVAENEAYFRLAPAERQQGFFDGWTRKEAVVKALGQGLTFPLRDFDVSLAPGEPARLLRLKAALGPDCGWCLSAVRLAPGYAAAVVVQGSDCSVEPMG